MYSLFVSCARNAFGLKFSGVNRGRYELSMGVSVCSVHFVPWGNLTD